jgi:hypothetical protein
MTEGRKGGRVIIGTWNGVGVVMNWGGRRDERKGGSYHLGCCARAGAAGREGQVHLEEQVQVESASGKCRCRCKVQVRLWSGEERTVRKGTKSQMKGGKEGPSVRIQVLPILRNHTKGECHCLVLEESTTK